VTALSEAFWDTYAAVYPGLEDLAAYRELCDGTVAAADVAGADVLELGCGTGSVTERMVAAGARVTAVERSRSMAARAVKRVEGAAVVRADIFSFLATQPDASFDRVVSQNVLYLLDDRPLFWSEVARVLRPDGFAVVATPTVDGNAALWGDHLRTEPWRSKVTPRLLAVGVLNVAITAAERSGDLGTVGADTHLAEIADSGAAHVDAVECYGPAGAGLDHRFVVRWGDR
jgi:SAM-dependent methyltransferase